MQPINFKDNHFHVSNMKAKDTYYYDGKTRIRKAIDFLARPAMVVAGGRKIDLITGTCSPKPKFKDKIINGLALVILFPIALPSFFIKWCITNKSVAKIIVDEGNKVKQASLDCQEHLKTRSYDKAIEVISRNLFLRNHQEVMSKMTSEFVKNPHSFIYDDNTIKILKYCNYADTLSCLQACINQQLEGDYTTYRIASVLSAISMIKDNNFLTDKQKN